MPEVESRRSPAVSVQVKNGRAIQKDDAQINGSQADSVLAGVRSTGSDVEAQIDTRENCPD